MASSLSDIKIGSKFTIQGEPYVVLSANFVRMQQRQPVMQTKLRNLISGKVLEVTFKPGDKLEEADLENKKATYLYKDEENAYFMDSESYEQFFFSVSQVEDKIGFLKEDTEVEVMRFEGKPVSIELPKKIDLKVTEAPPGIKGDTAQGGTKQITLETGQVVNAPLFIKVGDVIRVNTDTGEYVERA